MKNKIYQKIENNSKDNFTVIKKKGCGDEETWVHRSVMKAYRYLLIYSLLVYTMYILTEREEILCRYE